VLKYVDVVCLAVWPHILLFGLQRKTLCQAPQQYYIKNQKKKMVSKLVGLTLVSAATPPNKPHQRILTLYRQSANCFI